MRLGLWREGDQLPTVKDVVARLAINPNTVLKAYKELEREGLVTARQVGGTCLCGPLGGALACACRARGGAPPPPGTSRCAGTCPGGWPRRAGPGWTTRGSRRCS